MMIPGLDGLRAIAFLLVFAFHTEYLEFGWVGVQFFFVLSGYLITGILLDMKKALAPRDYFIKFYGRRFLRIFPLYYFYLLLMGGVVAWLISVPYRPAYMQIFQDQVWYAALYIYDFFFGTILVKYSYFLDHFWSLSVEEQFYIFWPLLILLVPEKWSKKLFVTVMVLGPVLRIAFLFIHRSGMFRILGDPVSTALYPMPFSHMDAFAFGAYISRYAIPKAKQQFWLLLVILPVIGFAAQYVSTGSIGNPLAFGYPLLMPNAYQFIWGYSLLSYLFMLTIYLVVNTGMFVRLLDLAPMRYLGKISYGLYVYHFPVIWFSGRIRDLGLSEASARPLTAVIAFLVTLGMASLSYRFMEKPLLNLKDRFFSLKPDQA
jgi:peptidoglycan/LPS O-acetylase OafA/YrhL